MIPGTGVGRDQSRKLRIRAGEDRSRQVMLDSLWFLAVDVLPFNERLQAFVDELEIHVDFTSCRFFPRQSHELIVGEVSVALHNSHQESFDAVLLVARARPPPRCLLPNRLVSKRHEISRKTQRLRRGSRPRILINTSLTEYE